MDNNKKLLEGLLKADGINPAGATEAERIAFAKMLDKHSKLKKSKLAYQPDIWRIIMKSRISKLVAAAVLIIGILLLLTDDQKTLYAKVIESFEKARTIYAVTKRLDDNGQMILNTEVWYEQGKGVAETSWSSGEQNFIRIDNGQYCWIYKDGFARRSATIDPVGVAKKLLNIDSFRKQAIREPAEDKVVNGIWYFAYIRSNPENNYRILSWLDETNRVREWEKMRLLDNGRWETYGIGQVEYNVDINPDIFVPDFGEDTHIVEVDTKLNEYFGLDDAIFTKEALGMIFAIHELKRCEEGPIFVVSSIRPTDESRQRVTSSGFGVWNYGHFHFGSSWKRVDLYGRGQSYEPIGLAELYHAGLQIRWTLFYPQGFEPKGPEECELEVYINNFGTFAEQRSESGLPIRERFKPIATLPLPEESTRLLKVLNKVYSITSELELIAAHDTLTLKSVSFTDEEMEEYIQKFPDSGETRKYRSGDRSKNARLHHGQSSRPSEISKEDWMKDRMGYLREIENNYKTFLEEVKSRRH